MAPIVPYILLDNCILFKLVNRMGIDRNLELLRFWKEEGKIELLVPPTLLAEWDDDKQEHKDRIEAVLSNHEKDLRRGALMGMEIPVSATNRARTILLSQLDMIDSLLASGIQIEQADEVDQMVGKQMRLLKAPFHKTGTKNSNDAYILFSTLDFCLKKGIDAFYFVSDNYKEYSDGDTLHPDMVALAPGITIHYARELKATIDSLLALGLPPLLRNTPEERKSDNSGYIEIDRSLPLIDQVDFFLQQRFLVIDVVPMRFFTEQYPFVDNWAKLYPKPFTLVTDKPEILQLLTEAPANEADRVKHLDIIKKLRFNYIYDVSMEKHQPVPLFKPEQGETCNCPMCLLRRFRYSDLIASLSIEDISKKKKAYSLYKLGHYIESALLYEELLGEKENRYDFEYYLLCFSLTKLAQFIERNYYGMEGVGDDIVERIRRINLEEVFILCSEDPKNTKLLTWLHRDFYTETHEKLSRLLRPIRETYYSQSSGSNYNTREFLEEFFTVDHFLHQNGVPYDYFLEFERLSEIFVEGMVASYANSERMSGKLSYINDKVAELIVQHGNAEQLQKWMKRYHLESWEYKQGDAVGFVDRMEHFLLDHPATLAAYHASPYIKNDAFLSVHSEMVFTGVTLIATMDVTDKDANRIASALLPFLQTDTESHWHVTAKHVRYFLHKKQKQLTPAILKQFFLLFLKKATYHQENNYDSINQACEQRKIKLNLTKKEFALVENHFMKMCPDCKTHHSWYFLCDIFNILKNRKQKKLITDFCISSLRGNFNGTNYYQAVLSDLIGRDPEFEKQFIAEAEDHIMKGVKNLRFNRDDYYTDAWVDEYLNYCLCYKIEVPAQIKTRIAALDPYYEWLLNLDSFDYAKFDTDWLYHNFTKYYKQYYRTSKKLMPYMVRAFENNPLNDDLPKLITNIYFR